MGHRWQELDCTREGEGSGITPSLITDLHVEQIILISPLLLLSLT